MLEEGERLVEVGRVSHFYTRISVAVVDLVGELCVGDRVVFRGARTDFGQVVESMQIEHENVERAGAGQSIGLKVKEKAREGDTVYKIV